MKNDIKPLEDKIGNLVFLLFVFAVLSFVNLGYTLWYLQQKSEPDWNFISVTLTIFEILLALALIGGFWMLRGAAQAAAEREAREVAERVATEVAERVAPPAAIDAARTFMTMSKKANKKNTGSSQDLTDMINSLGESHQNDDDSENGQQK